MILECTHPRPTARGTFVKSDSMLAPSQWATSLQCNAVSHRLGVSALIYDKPQITYNVLQAIWPRHDSMMHMSWTHMVWLKVLPHLFYMVNKTLAMEIKVYRNCAIPRIPRAAWLLCLNYQCNYAFYNGLSNRCFHSITIFENVWFNYDNCLLMQCSTGIYPNNFSNVFIFVFSGVVEQNWWKQMDRPV